MNDALFVLLTVAFFAVTAGYVRGCAKLQENADGI